jgi:hypothetical protein
VQSREWRLQLAALPGRAGVANTFDRDLFDEHVRRHDGNRTRLVTRRV